jgi:cytochrome c peroxidase
MIPSRVPIAIGRQALAVLLAALCTLGAWAAAQDAWLRPGAIPHPADNAPTEARVELGRTLFFDPRLSGTNQMSCATCHDPDKGWGDARPLAVGHDGRTLGRGSPTILNVAYSGVLMWDGRFATLEQQAIGPIVDPGEMNESMPRLVAELSAIPAYRERFAAAYPGEPIGEATIGKALAAFQRTVVSGESAFDRWRRGDRSALGDSARRGFDVFRVQGGCANCHMGFNFSDDDFHNIGVRDLGEPDPGRYAVTRNPKDRGAFKTPTLRDVALTAPYMRNGLYATLEEVVEHYVRGGDVKHNLSEQMEPRALTDQQKADLVAFMKSLTSEPRAGSISPERHAATPPASAPR